MEKIKIKNQILIMLAFFSISIGLWGNFRQLWLQDNNFLTIDISNIISLGTLISVIGIAVIGKYIKINKLKKHITYAIVLKFIDLVLLILLNKSGLSTLIKILIVIDIVLEYIIITSIYPLITNIIKTDREYSKRQLTEYLFRDVGILIGGLFIGKYILGILIDYNTCLIISTIFLVISLIVIINIDSSNIKQDKVKSESTLKYVFSNKILIVFLVFVFLANMAMSTALGLKMLTLTNYFNFTDSAATNYFLIIGLIADIIGIIALKYFTPKNDYITITIKFGIRLLGYALAFTTNNLLVTLVAITWSILISTSYENICDGPYINLVENEYQLGFTNLMYIVRFLGESFGIFFCGIMYEKGLRYMFGLSAIFMVFQITIAYYLIYLRKKNY